MDLRNRSVSRVGVRAANWGRTAAIALLFSLGAAQGSQAQSPNAAGSGAAKSDEGFYPGWTLGTRFESSTSGDGSVYDLAFGGGDKFLQHFWGSPRGSYYFVCTPSPLQAEKPQTGFLRGVGDNVGGATGGVCR